MHMHKTRIWVYRPCKQVRHAMPCPYLVVTCTQAHAYVRAERHMPMHHMTCPISHSGDSPSSHKRCPSPRVVPTHVMSHWSCHGAISPFRYVPYRVICACCCCTCACVRVLMHVYPHLYLACTERMFHRTLSHPGGAIQPTATTGAETSMVEKGMHMLASNRCTGPTCTWRSGMSSVSSSMSMPVLLFTLFSVVFCCSVFCTLPS